MNLFRQLGRSSPQTCFVLDEVRGQSRRQLLAVAGNVSNTHTVGVEYEVRVNTRFDGVCSAVRVADCFFLFFFLLSGVGRDVSRVNDCAQKFVLLVNDLLSSIETHGGQRAARVPKRRVQVSVHGTHITTLNWHVYVFFGGGTGASSARSRNEQHVFLMVTLCARGIGAETYDEGNAVFGIDMEVAHFDMCTTCIKKRNALFAWRLKLFDGHNLVVKRWRWWASVVTCLHFVDLFCGYSHA